MFLLLFCTHCDLFFMKHGLFYEMGILLHNERDFVTPLSYVTSVDRQCKISPDARPANLPRLSQ